MPFDAWFLVVFFALGIIGFAVDDGKPPRNPTATKVLGVLLSLSGLLAALNLGLR